MISRQFHWLMFLAASFALGGAAQAESGNYFRIEVVDDQTGRGVPFVELSTTSGDRFYTDSSGLAAIDSPEFMGRPTWFGVASHGYEYPADGFGFRGAPLTPQLGESAQLKIKRANIAERLYRVTGAGIYRDTVMLGEKPPIDEPLLNAQVTGQDSTVATIYQGKIFWVWGDTARLSYPLGHFATAGATSELPGRGGLDPSVGVDLHYFAGDDGFSKGMVQLGRPGLAWTGGLLTVDDESGRERLLAQYICMKDLSTLEESGLLVFNDETQQFDVLKRFGRDETPALGSHPIPVSVDGEPYYYFPGFYPRSEGYAHLRVKADWQSLIDPAHYEGFTCLKPGARYDKNEPPLERDAAGRLVWGWKLSTPPLNRLQLGELIELGQLDRNESPVRLVDVDTGQPLVMNGGSIAWNEYRQRWIGIAVNALPERFGGPDGTFYDVPGGDVYFAEANAPEGPWVHAKKVATHCAKDDNYDFYNPVHHPFFDSEGGRIIYFEGTLSTFFSKNRRAAPRYSYNQLMYRLDLSDPRLKLPAPPAGLSEVKRR